MKTYPIVAMLFGICTLILTAEADAKVKGAKSLGEGAKHTFEIIGFSQDEKSVAFLQYTQDDTEYYEEERTACAGYPKREGDTFSGIQRVYIYRAKQPLVTIPILDGTGANKKKTQDGCTPPSVAEKRWQEAEGKLKQYGIDRKAKGSTLRGEDMRIHPEGAEEVAIRVNQWGKEKESKNGNFVFTGTFALRQNEEVILRRQVQESYFPVMGTTMQLSVGPHFLSPTQKTLVVIVNEELSGGRGSRVNSWLFGMFIWEKNTLVAR